MNYRIDLTARAVRALGAIDKPNRRRVMAAIDRRAEEPRPAQSVKLSGRGE